LTGFTRGKTALKIPKFLKSWIVSSPHHPTLSRPTPPTTEDPCAKLGQDVFGLAIILLEVALHDMVKLDSKWKNSSENTQVLEELDSLVSSPSNAIPADPSKLSEKIPAPNLARMYSGWR
jgi:hypothetical protein